MAARRGTTMRFWTGALALCLAGAAQAAEPVTLQLKWVP